jgi:hypothetical protein
MANETASLAITCCSCKSSFKNRSKNAAPWRQRSLPVPASHEMLFAYLCGPCATRFSSEEAVYDYLDASLDDALYRAQRRGILVAS